MVNPTLLEVATAGVVVMLLVNGWISNLLSMLTNSNFWVIIFISGIIIETVLEICFNKKFILSRFGEEELNNTGQDIRGEIREYSTRALTLSGLTFAGIALLFGNIENNYGVASNMFLIMIFALFLFVIAYKIGVFSAKKRIFFQVEQRLVNYGLLGLVVSIYLLSVEFISYIFSVLFATMLIFIFALHIKEYINDFRLNIEKATSRKISSKNGKC